VAIVVEKADREHTAMCVLAFGRLRADGLSLALVLAETGGAAGTSAGREFPEWNVAREIQCSPD
jgi:hypothetical protein